jgi:TonB family protein
VSPDPNRARRITTIILFCALAAHGQTQPPASVDAGKTAPAGPVFRIGGGVTPPRITYQLSPEYSEEARAAGLEGTCILWLVVGADGKPRSIVVQRKLGLGLDEKAIEALDLFRFEPGMKDGKPVAVVVTAEVVFHLSGKNETSILSPTGPILGPTQTPQQQSQAPRIKLSNKDMKKLIVKRVSPLYPEIARNARLVGKCGVRVVITPQGEIADVLLDYGHPMIAPAAIDAVRKWKFRPYLLDGHPVEVEGEVEVKVP